jgi:hypothetical protein
MPKLPGKTTLEDTERDGDFLVLTRGQRLEVARNDRAVTSIWQPGARLTLSERKGSRTPYNLRVTNEETGETIAARLCS